MSTEAFAEWIQGWLSDPASNNGLRLHVSTNTSDPLYFKRIISSEEVAAGGGPSPDVPRLAFTWFDPFNWVDGVSGQIHLADDFMNDPAVVAELALGYNLDGDMANDQTSYTTGQYIVPVSNVTATPFRTVGRLVTETGNCSAWAIDQDTLITAAHCVYGRRSDGTVYQGAPRYWEPRRTNPEPDNAPYHCPLADYGVPQGWADGVRLYMIKPYFDWAFVKFDKSKCIGAPTIYALNYEPGRDPSGGTLRNIGYPHDGSCTAQVPGLMYTSYGLVTQGPNYYRYRTHWYADMTWDAESCAQMSGARLSARWAMAITWYSA